MTSNREPAEWLTMTADPLLAQSAIDRLTSTAHTLVIEGPSYRQRTRRRATLTTKQDNSDAHSYAPGGPIPLAIRWSHHPGKRHRGCHLRPKLRVLVVACPLPDRTVGHELVVAARMLIMAGDGLHYDELVEWSRVGYQRAIQPPHGAR